MRPWLLDMKEIGVLVFTLFGAPERVTRALLSNCHSAKRDGQMRLSAFPEIV
jgi:hypothetical protein